jgi:hypothetical protein
MSQKYTGRPLAELEKLGSMMEMKPHEFAFYNEAISKPVKPEEPGFLGKAGLLMKAGFSKVTELGQGIGQEITMAMIQQQLKDKKKAALNKKLNIASLDVLRQNNEISQEDYEAALEELNAL